MRVLIAVNGTQMASLDGPGYLSARFNVGDRGERSDLVELRVLADDPHEIADEKRRSAETARQLLTDKGIAKEVVRAIHDFESRLVQIVKRAERREPAEEYTSFKRAAGQVFADLGERLLFPVYRRHKELMPSNGGRLSVT